MDHPPMTRAEIQREKLINAIIFSHEEDARMPQAQAL